MMYLSQYGFFAASLLALGIVVTIFARKLAEWEYKFDLRWKMTFGIGINPRIWYFRVAGVILAGIALYILVQLWLLPSA